MKNKRQVEMKLYETLGVKQFQKMVFFLEKIIHFKDKGKNINYHIKNKSIDDLKDFQKFLYFNGAIHARNNIGLILFFIVQQLFLSDLLLVYIIPSFIKNLYCVMLQRYNYLRIEKVIEYKQKKIARELEQKVQQFNRNNQIEIKQIEDSLKMISDLKGFLNGQKDLLLDREALQTLGLIKHFIVPEQEEKTSDIADCDDKQSLERKNRR